MWSDDDLLEAKFDDDLKIANLCLMAEEEEEEECIFFVQKPNKKKVSFCCATN